MLPVRKVASIPAPSVTMVTPKSGAQIALEKGYASKGGVTTKPNVTHAEQAAREAASKKHGNGKKRGQSSAPAAKPQAKPAPVVTAPPVAKPAEPAKAKSPQETILAAVQDKTMNVIEACIRFAFLNGQAPEGAKLEQVLSDIFLGRANPVRPKWAPIPNEIRALFGGGIVSPKVERVTRNPLVDMLRNGIQSGELTQDEARSLLLSTTKDVKVKDGDTTRLVSRSALVSDVSIHLPPELVSARLAPEEKGEGKTIEVTFTMLRRGASDNEKARALLTFMFRQAVKALPPGGTMAERRILAGQKLGWTFDSAYAAWEATGELPDGLTIPETDVEVEATKKGTPGKLLAWAVGFLGENADCSQIVFETGTILTVFYNDPTTDPCVRAILGDPSGDGVAIKRSWIGDDEDSSCDLRAIAKGRDLMANGLKVGQKVYPVGTKLQGVGWAKALKPGQYTKIGVVTDKETGVEYPALFLMQKITGYKVDHVLRHEAIRAEGRGNALPTVESTLSVNGKMGGAVLDKKSYDRGKSGARWQKAKQDTCHFSHG